MKQLLLLFLCAISCTQLKGSCNSNIVLTSQAQVNDFFNTYGCSVIEGDLTIGFPNSFSNIYDLSPLSSITEITGDLIIQRLYSTTNLDGLANITSIGNDFVLYYMTQLNDFSGLQNISTVGGSMTLKSLPKLMDLNSLGSLTNIGDDFIIELNVFLENLNGLDNLNQVGGGLSIIGNYELTDISTLSNLQSIGTEIIIDNNDELDNLIGFENISLEGISLNISNNDALTDLSDLPFLTQLDNLTIGNNSGLLSMAGLENLTTISGDLEVFQNDNLIDLSGLNSLSTIDGSLIVKSNSVLLNLVGLENLISIGNYLHIIQNDNLIDLSGLNNLNSIEGELIVQGNALLDNITPIGNLNHIGGDLSVYENVNLSDCCVLYDLINTTEGQFDIYGNGMGCNTLIELNNLCTNSTVIQGLTSLNNCTNNLVLETSSGEFYELVTPVGFSIEEGFLYEIVFPNETLIPNSCPSIDFTIEVTESTLIPYDCNLDLIVIPIDDFFSSTPIAEVSFSNNGNLTDFYDYELTIDGISHTTDFSNDTFTVYPEIELCEYFTGSTEYMLSAIDPLGNIACTVTQSIYPANYAPIGTHSICPFTLSICEGEGEIISGWMLGAFGTAPDAGYCTSCEYTLAEGNGPAFGSGFSIGVSPLTTTTYTYTYAEPNYNNYGTTYILVEVEDCGTSSDAGITSFIKGKNYFYEGEKDVRVSLKNFGSGLLENIQVHWSVNGVEQPIYDYQNITLPGDNSVWGVNIGTYLFNYETEYELELWTALPNGSTDTDTQNDTLVATVFIEDLGADSTLVHAADDVVIICQGDTIIDYIGVVGNNCGPGGTTFAWQDLTPVEWVSVENLGWSYYTLFPPETNYFELNYLITTCFPTNPTSYEVYVLVKDCNTDLSEIPDYSNIFFDNCDNGDLYFFIETPSGEILDPYYTDSVDFTHFDGMLVDYEYVEADFDSPCSGATAVYITEIVEVPRSLELNIWLEGVGETADGLMETDLNNLGVLPTTQPFNQAPWFYNGTETLPLETDEIVDWVLVELRSGIPNLSTSNTEVIFQQAAVVLSDGSIVDAESLAPIDLYGIAEGENYYVSIRHRNHLDVLSATPITFDSTNSAAYDFTTSQSQAFGPVQLTITSTGKVAMYAGDYNGDGVIQSTDYDVWQSEPAVVNVYAPTDGNLDGIIQTTDFDVWLPNKAKVGASEIQY